MIVSDKERESVTALAGDKRYRYFIKRVVDTGVVWGLWQNGWALATTESGEQVFPLWPAKEFASACAMGDWSSYAPEEIDLESLIDDLAQRLADSGVLAGVFPTPSEQGVTPELDGLVADLRAEMGRY